MEVKNMNMMYISKTKDLKDLGVCETYLKLCCYYNTKENNSSKSESDSFGE
jgi:hypothetical protein